MSTPEKQPASISRRESLKRAAGALAVGIGAPLSAFSAPADGQSGKTMLSFYKGSERITVPGCCKRSDLLHTMEIPEELAEMLMEPGALRFLKLGDISGGKNVVYTTLMEGEREERR